MIGERLRAREMPLVMVMEMPLLMVDGAADGNAFGRTPSLYLLRRLCNLKLKNFKQRLFQ